MFGDIHVFCLGNFESVDLIVETRFVVGTLWVLNHIDVKNGEL